MLAVARRLAAPVLVFVLALVVSVPAATAAFPGANGKIAFTSPRDGVVPSIWTIDQYGLGDSKLAIGRDPAWSHDGLKLALSKPPSTSSPADIFVVNADGTGLINVTNEATFTDSEPAWSPTGTRLAFVRSGDIFAINVNGSGLTNLTNTAGSVTESSPTWSPDGTQIAYQRQDPSGKVELWKMTQSGTGQVAVTTNTGVVQDLTPDWSPNGQLIAFSSNRPGSGDLGTHDVFTVRPDGTDIANVTNFPAQDVQPAWAPDGSRIVFVSLREFDNGDLFSIRPDGTGLARLTTAAGGDENPSWQPVSALTGGYPRPMGATPVRVPLVPSYQQCSSPINDWWHNPPLQARSCVPPVQSSRYLTVGSPDVVNNERPVKSIGFVRLGVNGAGGGDIRMEASITDVRCQGYAGGCTGMLVDYGGGLQVRVIVRLTDKYNAHSLLAPGTVADFPLSFDVPCAATGDPNIGSSCGVTTMANAVIPGAVTSGKRMIWEFGQVELFDGGPDGNPSTADNGVFARQGLFVP